MNKKAMFSSLSDSWGTPEDLFKNLNKEFKFDLDACANHKNAKCARYISVQSNGLVCEWHKFAKTVWCNPPYGRNIGEWVEKGCIESLIWGCTVVMLLPARTDTKWFHRFCLPAAEIRFKKGRLKFTNDDGETVGRAPFPSMVVIFRPVIEKPWEFFGMRGQLK